MSKLKIVAVSYYNTLPMLYGLEKSSFIKQNAEIELAYPSLCAQKLIDKEVDIALVPTGIIPRLKISYIVSKYCIGATGKVASVVLASHKPLNEIKNIYLDYQSATSVRLVKVLAKNYWRINPQWQQSKPGYENLIIGNTGGVIIGDRCFNLKKYEYVYDLAEEWNKFTGLPFVFAAWVSLKPIDDEFKKNFNEALQIGVNDIDAVINHYKNNFINGFDAQKYYKENISFLLDDNKSRGMNMFFKYLATGNFNANQEG